MTSVSYLFLLFATLSNMFTESNMSPRYVNFCVGKKVLLSGCIRNPKLRNIFLVLMLPVRHSSYVSPNIIRSSMKIAIMIPSNFKTVKGGFVNFVNFLGPGDNPFA